MRPALEYVCGKQMMNTSFSFFLSNLTSVFDIKMEYRVGSRSVHNVSTGKKNDSTGWRLPINKHV